MIRIYAITLGLVLLPTTAFAALPSPWVGGVILKAEEGISMAAGLSRTGCDFATLRTEFEANQDLFRQHADLATDLGVESQLLRERTVCFEHDRRLLLDEATKVAQALLAETQSCKLDAARALRENYSFLLDSYRSFLAGSADPSHTDDRLTYRWRFHDQELWNEGAERKKIDDEISPEFLCPYTTDYGARSLGYVPTILGGGTDPDDLRRYGCDKEVLESIPAPNAIEAQALKAFIEKTDEASMNLYRTITEALYALDRMLFERTGEGTPPPPPDVKELPPHETVSGCLRPEEPNPLTVTDEELEALLLAYPDYFEEYNLQTVDIFGVSLSTFGPTPEFLLPQGILFRPTTDYFLTTVNPTPLIRAFGEKRAAVGAARPLPPWLLPQEDEGIFSFFMRLFVSTVDLSEIAVNVERNIGLLETEHRDAAERMRDASEGMEDALQSLLAVTNEEDGLLRTRYIPDFAYFLARSCVDGHCQETLKTVAKRTFNPYCAPYVSGKFTEENAAKKCFCDPSIQDSWGEWDTYCSDEVPSDLGRAPDDLPMMMCLEQAS